MTLLVVLFIFLKIAIQGTSGSFVLERIEVVYEFFSDTNGTFLWQQSSKPLLSLVAFPRLLDPRLG